MTNTRMLLLLVVVLISACASVQNGLYPAPENAPDNRFIHLVYHANHTGIILNMDEASPKLEALRQQFPANYLVFNWGDRRWYAGGAKNVFTSAAALVVPSQSALRILGMQTAPEKQPKSAAKIKRIELSQQGYDNLLSFIESSFLLDADDHLIRISSGKTKIGSFQVFAAQGKYHMFQNSNSWSSQALASAGVKRSMLGLVVGNI